MRYSEGKFITKQMKRSNRRSFAAFLCLLFVLVAIFYSNFDLMCSNLIRINADFEALCQDTLMVEKTNRVYGGSIVDYTIVKNIDKPDVYEQYPFYRFKIKPEHIVKTSAEYGVYKDGVWTRAYGLYIAEYNGVKFGVVDELGLDVDKKQTLKGLWIKTPSYIKNDLGFDLADGETLTTIPYYFDARKNTYVDLDGMHFLWYRYYMIFVLVVAYIVLRNLFVPKKSYTYDQLTKYGDGEEIALELDNEIPEDFKGKRLVTETWIVEKKWFRTKIMKNHRKKTRFDG